jgi:quercetin dioxygenase-like cupin family protein
MNRKHALVVAAGTAGAVLLSLAVALPFGQAGATPGSGVSSSVLARGTTHRDIRVHARQPSDVVVARVTLQPGGSTGWHTHPGPLVAVVESGTLTHYDRRCHARTYRPGQAFQETQRVHMGANKTRAPVVLAVTYLVPGGGPLSDDAGAPRCAADLRADQPAGD